MTTNEPLQPQELAPVKTQERIVIMDLLRGFALIGILLMNIEWFNRPISELLSFDYSSTGADYASSWLVLVFVQGKFYKLFALLFGMGFAVMLLRAEQVGRPFKAWFTRRMLVLYLIGLAHMAFLWGGDILHDYAVGGMMLLGVVLLMRTKRFAKRNRPAVYAKIGFYMIFIPLTISVIAGAVYGTVKDQTEMKVGWQKEQQVILLADKLIAESKENGTFNLTQAQYDALKNSDNSEYDHAADDISSEVTEQDSNSEALTESDSVTDTQELIEPELTNEQLAQKRLEAAQKRDFRYAKEAESLLNPSYLEVTKYRWDYAVSNLSNSIIFGLGVILPLFLVGYWLVASGKMSNIEKHRTFFKVMCVGGLAFGIPVSIGAALIMNHPATKGAIEINSVSNSLFYFGQFALCSGYLGAIALLSLKAGFVRWFGWLSPIGKMALTNYIMHSVILSSIFYGYGFAQFGNIPRSEQMLMVVAIIVFQAIVSSLWLRVFNYGPLEWLWRCATYMKLQPMKRVS
ncbi:DUF418 domain-containing protein [Psychrosphaera aestuarii]|uniref:DUF418 domain-containing protein n=1 Tax=Psychrosphaera aestuarii TaxID=1266052 RepID=UPI001B343263|nr:DUF418 domain-containing protein [Psychrosphaera aestuarii]